MTELRDLSELYPGKPYYSLSPDNELRIGGDKSAAFTCSKSGYVLAEWMSRQKAFASIFEKDRFKIEQVGRVLDTVALLYTRRIELIKFQRLRKDYAKFMQLVGKADEAKRWLERSRRPRQRRISDYEVLIINMCVVLKRLMKSPRGRNVMPFCAWITLRSYGNEEESKDRHSEFTSRREPGGPLALLTYQVLLEYFPAETEIITHDGKYLTHDGELVKEMTSRVTKETKLPGREAFERAFELFIEGGYSELIE